MLCHDLIDLCLAQSEAQHVDPCSNKRGELNTAPRRRKAYSSSRSRITAPSSVRRPSVVLCNSISKSPILIDKSHNERAIAKRIKKNPTYSSGPYSPPTIEHFAGKMPGSSPRGGRSRPSNSCTPWSFLRGAAQLVGVSFAIQRNLYWGCGGICAEWRE